MDHRLVLSEARSRRAKGVLHSGKSARRTGGRELRLLACPTSRFRARCSKAARTCALLTIAAAIVRPRAMRRRSILPQAMLDFGASFERKENDHERARYESNHDSTAKPPQYPACQYDTCCSVGAWHGRERSKSRRASQQQAAASGKQPNILVIMGDDVGWFNIGAYHQGIMSGKTPNLDKLAADGMRFTDYYAEASCTAGRANFITGQIPLRTGLTTVGQAGADVGMPDQSVTTALLLKSMGYATGQFGKNHLGDLNKYLPTVHGFDEFFGYLYHLDAMSDPYWFDYPQDWIDKYGPRNLVHSYATDVDDPTVMPRWGKVGKQRIVDEGPLKPFKDMSADHQMWQKGRDAKYDMETFDEVLVEQIEGLHGSGQAGRQAVLHLAQHHAHARLHLSVAEVPGEDELQEQFRPGRSRHGADGRRHRRSAQAPRRYRRHRQHHRDLHDR